jgi:hypothetical protein
MYCQEYTNLKEKVVIDEFVPKPARIKIDNNHANYYQKLVTL